MSLAQGNAAIVWQFISIFVQGIVYNKKKSILGQVDEEYIAEAAPVKRAVKSSIWNKWGALAVCFALVIAISIPSLDRQKKGILLSDTFY